MKNYKIIIEYDGSRYNGWQRQGNTQNTVQEKIENVLGEMVGHKIEINGSGRTDKGVHAKAQTASVKMETPLVCSGIRDYLNRYLPEDIGVSEVCEADGRFHARLSAKSKTYVYRILNSPVPNVFERKYMFSFAENLNVEKMNSAAKLFLGTHDFLGFSSVGKTKKSTVRTVTDISVVRLGGEVRIEISGNGFLYNMVRIISGTLLEIGLGKRHENSVEQIFVSRTRSLAGPALPAKGLTLLRVDY